MYLPSSSSLPAGEDDDDDECGEEKLPSCFDYVMHFLTVFWKVLFAFVPPTDYWNGWACFVVSICMIGLLTAVIGRTSHTTLYEEYLVFMRHWR